MAKKVKSRLADDLRASLDELRDFVAGKKTGAVVSEVSIPGMMGSMPMTYMVNGKQYIAFTSGTPTEPAEVVALALEKR